MINKPARERSSDSKRDFTGTPSPQIMCAAISAMNVEKGSRHLKDVVIRHFFPSSFLVRKPTPVLQPFASHPKPAACISQQLTSSRQQPGFISVVRANPARAKCSPRNEFLDAVALHENRS